MFNLREKTEMKMALTLGIISGITAIINYYRLKKLKKIKRQLKQEGYKSVKEIKLKLSNDQKEFEFERVNSLYNKVDLFVQGRLTTKHPIFEDSKLNSDLNLLMYIQTNEKKTGNFFNKEEFIKKGESINIELTDYDEEKYKIKLLKNKNENLIKIAELKKFEKIPYSEINNQFFDVLNFFLSILSLNLSTSLLDFKLINREKIYGINLNTPIFMYCTIFINKTTHKIFVEPNEFIAKSINLIKKEIDDKILKSTILFVSTTIITGYFINIIRKTLKKFFQNRNKKNELLKETLKIENLSRELQDAERCIVCMDFIRNLILLPCKHICICHICYEEMGGYNMSKCPVCKAVIERHVFISFNN